MLSRTLQDSNFSKLKVAREKNSAKLQVPRGTLLSCKLKNRNTAKFQVAQ